MRTVYVLFANTTAMKSAKVHGGGVYARWVARELRAELAAGGYDDVRLCVLWPKGVVPQTEEEAAIYRDADYHVREVSTLEEVPFQPDDTLFIPLTAKMESGYRRLKQRCPSLKLKAVIHGFRERDLLRYESYQKYYHRWYRPLPGMGALSYIRHVVEFWGALQGVRYVCRYADELYTVSNCSMQMLIRYGKPKSVKYYHSSVAMPVEDSEEIETRYDDKYLLLVNANRNEKNCLRALAAFCRYKEKNPSDPLKFYAVGATDDFRRVLPQVKTLNSDILRQDVVFFDYVTQRQLKDLYAQCCFLLYPSKSEGYGVPPLDALEYGKPVVATRVMSVPEVIGAAAYYVDPYDTDSIAQGIAYMSDAEHNRAYQQLMREVRPMIHLRQKVNRDMLVRDILKR